MLDFPSLPPLPLGAGDGGAPVLAAGERQAIKQELKDLEGLAGQLAQKISELSKKLEAMDGSGAQLNPPPALPGEPGKVGEPSLAAAGQPGAGGAPGAADAAGAAGAAGAGPAGGAAAAPPPKLSDLKYPVSRFVISYADPKPSPKLPPIAKLEQTKVELGIGGPGFTKSKPPKKDVVTGKKSKNFEGPIASLDDDEEVRTYDGDAVQAVYAALANEMNRRGFYGVLVLPDPADIDATTGDDLRAGRKPLKIQIFTSTVRMVRTISKQVKPGENAVDTAPYKWIAAGSPLKPGSPLQKPQLQDYLTSLNRFPGRRVDAAINGSGDPGGIVLDYIVRQEKPFYVYSQASNTGTESTGDWRIRTGFEYRNLFTHDDIFTTDYVFSTDFQSQYVFGSYQIALLPPDKLKLRLYGSYGQFTASDVGFDLQNFDGVDWTVGAAFTLSPFKIKGVPIDLIGGVEFKSVSVVNHTFPQDGNAQFFTPYAGFGFAQATDRYSYSGGAQVYWNVPSIAGTTSQDTDQLGRFGTSANFTILKYNAATAFYLEPIIFGDKWKDGSTWWKSTLAHEISITAHGQYTFGNSRLVPQYEDVIGGFTTVRGYPEAITAGDSSLIANAEYRIHVPRLFKPADKSDADKALKAGTVTPPSEKPPGFALRPNTVGSAGGRADWDLILRGFFDLGMTFNNDLVPSAEANETLMGTGFGVELQISKYLDLRMDYGIALRSENDFLVNPVHRGDSRFHFLFSLLW